MSNGIKLSPKYGVNPTMGICFWCGEPTGEIALLGKIGVGDEDLEAPKYSVIGFEPCKECKANMEQGFTLIEATSKPNKSTDREIQPGVYPTGRHAVVKIDAAKEIFGEEAVAKKKGFIDIAGFDKIINTGE